MSAEAYAQPPSGSVWSVEASDEAATTSLAADIAALVKPGDLITLSGELGSGKTTFARALIRALAGDPELEVPSPTFTLIQVYESAARDGAIYPIVHADLFRIKDATELAELGWEEAAEGALVIVEWPERAGTALTGDRLDVAFAIEPDRGANHRSIVVSGVGAFGQRLALSRATRAILERSGFAGAQRTFMMGDASTRAYERLTQPGGHGAILMIAPQRPDGPPIRFGKPYSAIAHLAENIRPYLAVGTALRGLGYSAPAVYAHDSSAGLAVIEDLGADLFVDGEAIRQDRYGAAVDLLADLHGRALPTDIPDADGGLYTIPAYDLEALVIEAELLPEWYAAHLARTMLPSGVKANFLALWRGILEDVVAQPSTWTLRDFHSPNLLWLDSRSGLARVGLLDFQDCVIGHPAYDVVSLLQDARVTVPADVELKLLIAYAQRRRASDPTFDMAAFAKAYAILGAQRATKILGIFARLDKRDRKPQYLVHIPRIQSYLQRNLAHPALAELKLWFEQNVPTLVAPAS
jgi:tRNA threonylcarbamoyl adenosine modification protein YjeE